MKHISKHNEPEDFKEWKTKNPTATYDDLGHTTPSIKQILKNELLEEQGYLCCYCERSILNAQRAATLQPFLDPNLTVEDLESMKKNYLAQRPDGKFNPFYTMIKNLF